MTSMRPQDDTFDNPVTAKLDELSSCLYRISVKGVIIRDNKVLLVQEVEGWYGLPGGGLDHGEDISQALIREVNEELNLELGIDSISDRPLFALPCGVYRSIPRFSVFYSVDLPLETQVSNDALKFVWAGADELKDLGCAPDLYFSRDLIRNLL